jgi:hypothetical protein
VKKKKAKSAGKTTAKRKIKPTFFGLILTMMFVSR